MTTSTPDLIVDSGPNPNVLKVTFPYDAQAVSLIKTVPGKRYYRESKHWTIPARSLRSLQMAGARRNISVVVSASVSAAQRLGQQAKAQLTALKELDDSPLELPTKTDARPYQRAGIRFLQSALRYFNGALLADDMGLGKTFQALSIVALSRVQSVLVLAPATLKYVWAEEIEKHYPQLSFTVIEGAGEARRALWDEKTLVKIANYEIMIPLRRRDEDGAWETLVTPEMGVRARDWDLLICDEATKIKNYKTATARTVKRLSRRYSLGLSGAPVENRLEELHSIMDFVMPGLLGTGWQFFEEHCVTNYFGSVVGYRGIETVKKRIAPHYIRRVKDEVLTELPPKTVNNVYIEMTGDEWALYEVVRDQIRDAMDDSPKLKVGNILTMMLRLKQCADDARLLDEMDIPSSKLAALRELLEASEGHKVVAFTQFAQFARLLADEFGGLLLEGEVPPKERAALIRRFQEGDERLLVSTEAGAYGITLTAADIVVHVDQPWNPARLRQREDRLHRIGQRQNVQVVNLIAKRTIDEYVMDVIHRKRELIKSVFDEESDVPEGAITKADLLALLGLGSGDV